MHRRGVHRAASGEGVGDLGDPGARGRGRAADRLGVGAGGHPERAGALEAVRHRGDGSRHGSGRPARAPVVVVPEGRPVGGRVEQHLADVDGLAAVDQDLVALGQQRDAAVLEALHEVALPQRTAPVERPRRDARDELAELVHRSRARQRGASYVVAEVEALVVHPGRVGQPPRHQLQALPVARDEGDPVGDQLHEPVVVEAGLPRVEDLHRRVVHGRRGGLCGQDGQVPRPEPHSCTYSLRSVRA